MASRSERGPALRRGVALSIASLLMLCSLPVAGLAQTLTTSTWTGGTGDWSVSSNWNPATVPNGGYDVIINTGAVTLDQSASIADLTLASGQSLSASPGYLLTVSGPGGASTITNNGAITLNNASISPGMGSLTLSGSGTLTLSNGGALGSPGSTLVNDTLHTIRGTGTIGNQVTNNGTITADQSTALTVYLDGTSSNSNVMQATGAGGLILNVTGSFTNTGTLRASSGSTLSVSGSLANYSAGTLTGGTYDVAGTLVLPVPTSESIQTNAATVILNGASASIIRPDSSNALSGFSANATGGSFTITNGANFTTAGAFGNAGSMTFGTGSTFAVGGGGAYTQTAGTTVVNGGLSASLISIQGGVLQGAGSINGGLTVGTGGSLHPGNSPGVVTVNGTYSNTDTLAVDVLNAAGGPGTGYSQLVVNSTGVTVLGAPSRSTSSPGRS